MQKIRVIKMTVHQLLILAVQILSLLFLSTGCMMPLTEEEIHTMLRLDAPTEESDLSVMQLIAKMQQANDPNHAFSKSQSYMMVQRVVSEKIEGKHASTSVMESNVKFQQPNKMLQSTKRGGKTIKVILFRDEDAFVIEPVSKKTTKIPEGTGLNLIRTFASIMNPMKNMTDIFAKVELHTVYENGKRYYRVTCYANDPQIAPYVYYVDQETFLTKKAETILYTDDGMQCLYTAESQEYKWMQNVLLPLKIKTTILNRVDIITMEEFVLNPEFPEGTFDVPKNKQFIEY